MIHCNRNSRNISDPRTQSISIIWGCAVGMFALCIPLVRLTTGAAIIPFAIALGAGAGTAVVWRSDRRTKNQSEHEQQYWRSLEERIANLETIASHGELDTQQFKQLDSQQRHESQSSLAGD